MKNLLDIPFHKDKSNFGNHMYCLLKHEFNNIFPK
jgi:hypothetical protein